MPSDIQENNILKWERKRNVKIIFPYFTESGKIMIPLVYISHTTVRPRETTGKTTPKYTQKHYKQMKMKS